MNRMITLTALAMGILIMRTAPSSGQELVFRANFQYLDLFAPSGDGGEGTDNYYWWVGNFSRDQPPRPGPCFNSPETPTSCASSMANSNNSFKVYRVDQVDSMVSALKNEVEQLNSQIQSLSDANDALTKRLDQLGKKPATHGVSATHSKDQAPRSRRARQLQMKSPSPQLSRHLARE